MARRDGSAGGNAGQPGIGNPARSLAEKNPKQARELRAYADELTGVLATAKVLRQLHRPVKMMQEWDAISRDLLQVLNSKDKRANVLTPREQAATYFLHSAASLGRVAGFSCYLAGVAGAAIPSLVLAGLIVVPAGIHTTIMLRDYFRSQENYYKNRALAFENMGRALRGLENWPNCSMDDAIAMLCFRDALSQLPEKSRAASLDANRLRYAALRDQAFMPLNVLTSCIGQILNLVLAPQWATSLSLGLSSAAYFAQGVLDWLQGDVEEGKADEQAQALQDWLTGKAASESMQTWASRDRLNGAALTAMQAHIERTLRELEPESFGGGARKAKGTFNFVNGGLSTSAATLPAFKLAPRSLATIAGTVASGVSLAYMAATGVKVLLRGNVKENARERYRQAQLMMALMDPAELLAAMNHHDDRPWVLEIPCGEYDEFNGFACTCMEFRPWENEFIALEALAEAVEGFALGGADGSADNFIASILIEQWNMKALDWVNLLRVAGSMRNAAERLAFIKRRLAGVTKVDFSLDANQMEPELPAPVLVQAFLQKLSREAYDSLESMLAAQADEEAAIGAQLREKLMPELSSFGEQAFMAAMEEVWAQRKTCSHATRACLQLQLLQVLAQHLQALHKLMRDSLLQPLEGGDGTLLAKLGVPAQDIKLFVSAVRQLLDAPPKARGQRRSALYHLARMKLTQDLRNDPGRFAKLACLAQLDAVLCLIDENVGPPLTDEDDLLVSVSSSQSSDSVRVDGEESESEFRDSRMAPSVEQAQNSSSTSMPQAGTKLLGLVKRPFSKHRRPSKRASAVLTEVVAQLPAQSPGPAADQGQASPLQASPSRNKSYTSTQPRETPLSTPRQRRVRSDMAKKNED